tara:strand:+ start:148416 stop:148763 length:348 start_codon:yes stop_codon:yes gene_type:complete
MQLVVAIIQPTKLSTVRDALEEIGLAHFTVCDALGYGRQLGQTAKFRGNEYRVDLLRKIAIEIAIDDEQLQTCLNTIQRSALTGSEGQIGDGKIFVIPIAEAIDLASGQIGPTSL